VKIIKAKSEKTMKKKEGIKIGKWKRLNEEQRNNKQECVQ
jgi:hypothetical protein